MENGSCFRLRGVISFEIWYGVGEKVRIAILVLQAFTVERRTTGRAANQKTAATHFAGQPDEVADALQAEH